MFMIYRIINHIYQKIENKNIIFVNSSSIVRQSINGFLENIVWVRLTGICTHIY